MTEAVTEVLAVTGVVNHFPSGCIDVAAADPRTERLEALPWALLCIECKQKVG
jgi:hypothetical protein